MQEDIEAMSELVVARWLGAVENRSTRFHALYRSWSCSHDLRRLRRGGMIASAPAAWWVSTKVSLRTSGRR